jgi:hypothetical protein
MSKEIQQDEYGYFFDELPDGCKVADQNDFGTWSNGQKPVYKMGVKYLLLSYECEAKGITRYDVQTVRENFNIYSIQKWLQDGKCFVRVSS